MRLGLLAVIIAFSSVSCKYSGRLSPGSFFPGLVLQNAGTGNGGGYNGLRAGLYVHLDGATECYVEQAKGMLSDIEDVGQSANDLDTVEDEGSSNSNNSVPVDGLIKVSKFGEINYSEGCSSNSSIRLQESEVLVVGNKIVIRETGEIFEPLNADSLTGASVEFPDPIKWSCSGYNQFLDMSVYIDMRESQTYGEYLSYLELSNWSGTTISDQLGITELSPSRFTSATRNLELNVDQPAEKYFSADTEFGNVETSISASLRFDFKGSPIAFNNLNSLSYMGCIYNY